MKSFSERSNWPIKPSKYGIRPNLPSETLEKYRKTEAKADSNYTLEDHEHLLGDMHDVFQAVRKRILNIDSSVREEFKKLYIAYKCSTNFVDIVPQKARLVLSLNIPFHELNDPLQLGRDVTGIGRWGNGFVEIGVSNISDLEYAMELVQQAFDAQMDED